MDVRDNPARDSLARLAILAGGGFVLYRFAQSGGLGPTAKSLADSLWGAAASTQIPNVGVSIGGGGVAVGGASGGGAAPGRCPDFVSGVQYVADRHDGTFETVIGGQLVFTGTQAEAEAQYRHRMGCG